MLESRESHEANGRIADASLRHEQAAATLLPPLCLVLRRLSLLLSVGEHKAKAAMIQRLWRGWFSRLHVHDFYMRRDYLVKARHTVPLALAGPSSECFKHTGGAARTVDAGLPGIGAQGRIEHGGW